MTVPSWDVITNVTNSKEEALVTLELRRRRERGILKINLSLQGIEPLSSFFERQES